MDKASEVLEKFRLSQMKGIGNEHYYLGVRNVTGLAEEKGFRLYWCDPNSSIIVPALGLVTSNPFRRESDAITYGEKNYGAKAKRIK